jgi:hypothetical protein
MRIAVDYNFFKKAGVIYPLGIISKIDTHPLF